MSHDFLRDPRSRRLGVEAWAAYSRHADLSHNAMVLYPLEGIGGTILSVAAAISFRRGGATPRRAALPLYAAGTLTIGGMLAATQAAPIMLSVRRLDNDPAALRKAFEGFHRWSAIRGVCQTLAFAANLWSLTALLKRD